MRGGNLLSYNNYFLYWLAWTDPCLYVFLSLVLQSTQNGAWGLLIGGIAKWLRPMTCSGRRRYRGGGGGRGRGEVPQIQVIFLVFWWIIHVCFVQVTIMPIVGTAAVHFMPYGTSTSHWNIQFDPGRCDNTRNALALPSCDSASGAPHIVTRTKKLIVQQYTQPLSSFFSAKLLAFIEP